jgi:maltooligosyltrehalose trehalohydrolase
LARNFAFQVCRDELHVGTFTREGSFDAVIPRIAGLKELGITAIEIMPVAQFPGARNWGYDGVYPFAVQDSYGGPHGLKRLVDACHQQGMAVALDVVYNHFGPEGNYVGEFAPYFTHEYHTPWGDALNFDGPHSDEVRRYFIENALQWIEEFHMDALRLDAIHAIIDPSARSFLEELGVACHAAGEKMDRQVFVIAENNRNDPRVVRSREMGGRGLDSEWNDDFHHALHAVLTGERNGYYVDYGGIQALARAIRDGFVYTGQYSKFREKRYGRSSTGTPGECLTIFSQNHDQIGNRMSGDRLSETESFDKLRLAAGTVLLSPYIPLLFMGEEYGELAPFQYFVSHSDAGLIEAVRKGRAEEFRCFGWSGEVPDPQDEQTFLRSKLNWNLKDQGKHAQLRDFYKELLRLRRQVPALARLDKNQQQVIEFPEQNTLVVERGLGSSPVIMVLHFGDGQANVKVPAPAGAWQKILDSADASCGAGKSVTPELANSDGEMNLTLGPWAFCVFAEA